MGKVTGQPGQMAIQILELSATSELLSTENSLLMQELEQFKNNGAKHKVKVTPVFS